ncbi:hypothetical protein [Alteribacillus persepolensis]|nr:hypothetical protein [Alteribacillus persepolensis]
MIRSGWTMTQIDEMDIHFYFEVMKDAKEEQKPELKYIDQVL